MFTVSLSGLEVYAYHGVSNEEQTIGHRYAVDVWLEVKGKADQTDKIGDTVDYGEYAKQVETWMKSSQVRTIERLAAIIAENTLEQYTSVQTVRVHLEKVLPPMDVILHSTGVELERSR